MRRRTRIVLWLGVASLVLGAAGVTLWMRRFHRYTPAEVVQDLRAGFLAQHAARPVERFLEIRYGPLSEPANRQRAFLDFFNVGHIEGLQIITRHMQGAQRETNIAAMAQWVSDYRRTLSPEEKQALRAHLGSDAGRQALHRATAQYLKQDVYYRAATARVIEELMTTLAVIQQP